MQTLTLLRYEIYLINNKQLFSSDLSIREGMTRGFREYRGNAQINVEHLISYGNRSLRQLWNDSKNF